MSAIIGVRSWPSLIVRGCALGEGVVDLAAAVEILRTRAPLPKELHLNIEGERPVHAPHRICEVASFPQKRTSARRLTPSKVNVSSTPITRLRWTERIKRSVVGALNQPLTR